MITQARAYQLAVYRKSIYETMIISTPVEERANAEAPRLASYAWTEIARLLATPLDHAFTENVQAIVSEIVDKWAKYCQTGIPADDIAEAVTGMQQREFQAASDRHLTFNPPEVKEEAETSSKGKKKVKAEEKPKELSPIINKEIQSAINPDAINMYIDEIDEEALMRRTPYLEMRDAVIADAARVTEAIGG